MGDSLLISSAQNGNMTTLMSCLQAKANPCIQDEFGISPLMYATWNGHVECVEELLKPLHMRGVNSKGKKVLSLTLVSKKGYTALHLAAISLIKSSVVSAITHILLKAGIDIDTLDNSGNTAYKLAQSELNQYFITVYESFIASLPSKEINNTENTHQPIITSTANSSSSSSNISTNQEPRIPNEYVLLSKLPEMNELATKRPIKSLNRIKEFVEECKINLEHREVYKTNSSYN